MALGLDDCNSAVTPMQFGQKESLSDNEDILRTTRRLQISSWIVESSASDIQQEVNLLEQFMVSPTKGDVLNVWSGWLWECEMMEPI